jgi:hypothetical protein
MTSHTQGNAGTAMAFIFGRQYSKNLLVLIRYLSTHRALQLMESVSVCCPMLVGRLIRIDRDGSGASPLPFISMEILALQFAEIVR